MFRVSVEQYKPVITGFIEFVANGDHLVPSAAKQANVHRCDWPSMTMRVLASAAWRGAHRRDGRYIDTVARHNIGGVLVEERAQGAGVIRLNGQQAGRIRQVRLVGDEVRSTLQRQFCTALIESSRDAVRCMKCAGQDMHLLDRTIGSNAQQLQLMVF